MDVRVANKPSAKLGWVLSFGYHGCHTTMKLGIQNRVSPEWGLNFESVLKQVLKCMVKSMFGPLEKPAAKLPVTDVVG